MNVMAIIESLLDIPNNASQYEFLVHQLLVTTFHVPDTEIVCELVDLESPLYKDICNYLHNEIIPLDLSSNQKKNLFLTSF
jgi:hypothetical protein